MNASTLDSSLTSSIMNNATMLNNSTIINDSYIITNPLYLEVGNSLYRFNVNSSTCYGKDFDDIFEGFTGQFRDSNCYTYIIQFIIVLLMYVNVGRGKYWLLLFIASLTGVCGAFIEHSTIAVICQNKYKNTTFRTLPTLLLNELFWIPSEYSIPLLNLIKMQAFSKEKLARFMRFSILLLGIPFICFRFLIGYKRMTSGYLLDTDIRAYHGGAFGIMAIADILCTFSILYLVKKSSLDAKNNNIMNHAKHSSYTILIVVDVVSLFLSILEIITNIGPYKDDISNAYVIPFHCVKNSFALILAADALIFKYGVSVEKSSSGNNSYSNNNNNNNNMNMNMNMNMNKSNGSGSIMMGKNKSKSEGSSNSQKKSYNNYRLINNYSPSPNDNLPSLNSNSMGRSKYNNNNNSNHVANISPYNYQTYEPDNMYSGKNINNNYYSKHNY